MAADADVPESVRDARWGANFEPNPHVPYQTTNTLFAGPRLIRQEIWIRENRLGHGGFGVVWLEKAHPDNRSPIRIRAVKELRVGHNDTRRQECIRELLALVKFSQQKFVGSFVEFYNWYESHDALFIAMEYCQHGDLRQYVKDHGALAEVEVQKITDQVLQGLMFMHENNFAHRDLKPANILIQNRPPDSEWKIKVGDMGLSKRIDVEASSTTVRGTPGFIAPERVPGIGSNPSATDPFPSDMWCLGEVTFFLLTSEKTFDSSMQLQGYYNGVQSFPEERLCTAMISQQAIDFIKTLMAAQPCDRLSAFQADNHPWMRDTSGMANFQQIIIDASSDISHPSTPQSRDPALSRVRQQLADASLDEISDRDFVVPESSSQITDTFQRTMSIPSGTWNSSAAHPVPEAGNEESTAAENFDLEDSTEKQPSGDDTDTTLLPQDSYNPVNSSPSPWQSRLSTTTSLSDPDSPIKPSSDSAKSPTKESARPASPAHHQHIQSILKPPSSGFLSSELHPAKDNLKIVSFDFCREEIISPPATARCDEGDEGWETEMEWEHSTRPTFRIDEKGACWTVIPQYTFRDKKTGKSRRLLRLEPSFGTSCLDVVYLSDSTDSGDTDDAYSSPDDDTVVRVLPPINRKRKYHEMLETAIRYIISSGGNIPEPFQKLSKHEPIHDSIPPSPKKDDAQDSDVFLSGNEEPSSYPEPKRPKPNYMESGNDMDIDGDRAPHSPRDVETHTSPEEMKSKEAGKSTRPSRGNIAFFEDTDDDVIPETPHDIPGVETHDKDSSGDDWHRSRTSPYHISFVEDASDEGTLTETGRRLSNTEAQTAKQEEEVQSNYRPPTVEDAENSD